MPTSFRSCIRTSLANENLQIALDGNKERRLRGRGEAFASLADPEGMRQRAHTVRADVIANLDRYLGQFIENVQANGTVVHRAADAAEAVGFVLEIARRIPSEGQAPVLIAKSKSMVSEEIHLNQALETAGLRVVETDLGEFIVQLRGEPPSHLITPAVHLRRQQVGELFHEKLGVPYTEEIPVMTNTARRVLRQVFLTADIGISGVNLGVVESGTLAVLTNEGNGRMVTTLPKVHVALMGIERLVPTYDDLALMLALLPRSATGQKITVYASLLHGPRRLSDADGPQERHLILIDNGRTAMRQSPLAEALYCIRCGACLNACPVFAELGGHAYVGVRGEKSPYPGPIGSVISAGMFGQAEYGQLARASTLCGACKEICPVDIDLPKLLLRIRAGQTLGVSKTPSNAPRSIRWSLRLFSLVSTHPRLYGLFQRLAGIGSRVIAPRSAWLRLPGFTGWGSSKDFPRPAVKPFQARIHHPATQSTMIPATRLDHRTPDNQISHPVSQSLVPLPERFAAELTALGGKVTFCQGGDAEALPGTGLAGHVLAFLRERNVQSIVAWEEGLPAGLLETLRANGIHISHDPDPSVRIGLTGALAGVAETGTLVLPAGSGRPLTASLLPEVHLAVLRKADIYENLPQVLKLREVREASALALVTGPSRTADIEMALTIGVHGPGEIHVFVLGDSLPDKKRAGR